MYQTINMDFDSIINLLNTIIILKYQTQKKTRKTVFYHQFSFLFINSCNMNQNLANQLNKSNSKIIEEIASTQQKKEQVMHSVQQLQVQPFEKNASLNQQIENLQRESQLLFEQLHKISILYSQKYTIYSEMIQNQNQDILDERDRLESNIEYLKSQNKKYQEQCRSKMDLKSKLLAQISQYDNKKSRLGSAFQQHQIQLRAIMKKNKGIQDSIKKVREQFEQYQQQIYNLDVRAENLKRYGYEIVPDKILELIEIKQSLQKEIQEQLFRKQQQIKFLGKFVKIQLSKKAREQLFRERQKSSILDNLRIQNNQLKSQNHRLTQLKDAYEWNPNLQIKQLETNLDSQQNKITGIQRQIAALKKKNNQVLHKIKQYCAFEKYDGSQMIESKQCESPRSPIKERLSKKDKYRNRQTIFEQIKNDLQLTNNNRFQWSTFLKSSFDIFGEQKKIQITQTSYKIIRKSQKFSIIFTLVILGILTFYVAKLHNKK